MLKRLESRKRKELAEPSLDEKGWANFKDAHTGLQNIERV